MTTPAHWESCLEFPNLAENEIHVWRGSLRRSASLQSQYESWLTPEEKSRAAKFLIPEAAEQFIAARGMLRRMLSAYTGGDPAAIRLTYGPQGKPGLLTDCGDVPLQFNLSHSDGVGVFAFAKHARVGIDLEEIRADVAGQQIAESYFTEQEAAEIRRFDEEGRAAAFFGLWTCKEAYLKARGEGLQIPLRSFQISIGNNGPQELIDERGSLWTIHRIDTATGFVAAVAAEGSGLMLRYLEI